jgi:hypothetical protein
VLNAYSSTETTNIPQEVRLAGRNRYSQALRLAMTTTNNPTGHSISIRQLSQALGYSYEHIRKILAGQPAGSREFNDIMCGYLGLDTNVMWRLAQEEKVALKYGHDLGVRLPKDTRLVDFWNQLDATDRERLVKVAEGMVLAGRALNPTRH